MKIENAKNLLIAIKDQIAKNLTDEDSLKFTEEFDNLIDNCNASKTYAKFCIKLLERVKLNVNPKYKEVLLILTAVINLFKNNGTREEFLKAASASASAAASASASASAAASASASAWAAYDTAWAAYDTASASTWAAYDTEYKQQSIYLLQVLKTKAGRPAGSKNLIKKEKNENRNR